MFKRINQVWDYEFDILKEGIHAIHISASCRGGKLLGFWGGEDLRVEIDGLRFGGLEDDDRSRYFDVPASWNGSELKGTGKLVIFVMKLSAGKHKMRFIPKSGADIMEEPEVKKLASGGLVTLLENTSPEEKDRSPWITVVAADLSLNFLDVSVVCDKEKRDSDDVKLVIDGRVLKNADTNWWGKNWYWQGRQLQGKIQDDRFYVNLPKGIHCIELWADKTPLLKELKLFLGNDDIGKNEKSEPKRIPTADAPKWTGDFNDDSEEIILGRLIFGEANNQPHEAKVWVGWSVVNRMKADSWWPHTIHGVILQDGQYDPFRPNDVNFDKIVNPLGFKGVAEADKASWYESYEIAKRIIGNNTDNPTKATHFHGIGQDREDFEKNIVPTGKFLKKIGDTYFYWSPN